MSAVRISGMRGAPGPHASDVHGVAKVLAVLGLGQPGGLAGGLARAPACASRAVPLALAVARVEIEKQPATQALVLSGSRHRCSLTGSSKTAPSATCTPARRSLKKTDINPGRRCVKDVDQKKTKDEEQARSHRLKKSRFGSALTEFPGFRAQPTVRGIFGEPKARVITLVRRSKKRFVVRVVERNRVGTTAACVRCATCPVAPCTSTWRWRCGACSAGVVGT